MIYNGLGLELLIINEAYPKLIFFVLVYKLIF